MNPIAPTPSALLQGYERALRHLLEVGAPLSIHGLAEVSALPRSRYDRNERGMRSMGAMTCEQQRAELRRRMLRIIAAPMLERRARAKAQRMRQRRLDRESRPRPWEWEPIGSVEDIEVAL